MKRSEPVQVGGDAAGRSVKLVGALSAVVVSSGAIGDCCEVDVPKEGRIAVVIWRFVVTWETTVVRSAAGAGLTSVDVAALIVGTTVDGSGAVDGGPAGLVGDSVAIATVLKAVEGGELAGVGPAVVGCDDEGRPSVVGIEVEVACCVAAAEVVVKFGCVDGSVGVRIA